MTELVAAIALLCNINVGIAGDSRFQSFKKVDSEAMTHACLEYYVNCVIGPNGEWNEKDLVRCIKEKK